MLFTYEVFHHLPPQFRTQTDPTAWTHHRIPTTTRVSLPRRLHNHTSTHPALPTESIRDESFLSKKHVVYHNMYSRPEYPHNDLPHNDFPFSLDLRGRNDPTS